MSHKNKWIGVLILGSLVSPSFVFSEPGRTALVVLTKSFDARAQSLGEALVADSSRLDVMPFNPAGMAKLNSTQVSATYLKGLVDDNIGYVNFGKKTPFGSLFTSLTYLDAGSIDLNLSNGTQGSRRAQQDMVGAIGLALGRETPISFGATAKAYRSELAEVESAAGFAADAGILWQTPLDFLSFGTALLNVGNDVKYANDDDSLPTTTRYGGRFLFDHQDNSSWYEYLKNTYIFNFEAVKPKDENISGNAGLEIHRDFGPAHFPMQTALRAGYIGASKALTAGAGFKADAIVIDYAINFLEALDLSHRVTLTYRFGEEKRKRALDDFKVNF